MSHFDIIDKRFRQYTLFNAGLERIADGCRWTEGPVWFGDANCLLFSDIPNNRMLRWIEGEGVSVYRKPSHYSNGNTRDLQGRLISCLHGPRAVVRTEHDGTLTTLVDRHDGKRLNSPNDVVVKSDGTIWFTDPHYGIAQDYEGFGLAEEELPTQVYRFDPRNGQLKVVTDAFTGPNGLCFSPDERHLYIADTGRMHDETVQRQIHKFDVLDAEDGRIGNQRDFYAPSVGAADGFRCDTDGNVWTSAGDGVHCVSPEGDLLGRIKIGHHVSNLTFGGHQNSRMFICATHEVYAIYLNRRGARVPGQA